MINPIEFFKNLIKSNSGYSSKRFLAILLSSSAVIIPLLCIYIDPKGELDESILILSAQFLASACGLLGFTLKESIVGKRVSMPEVDSKDVREMSMKESHALSSKED